MEKVNQEEKNEEIAKVPENENSNSAAPAEDKPGGEVEEIKEDDISDIIEILNEFQRIIGGNGNITSIPDELKGVIRFSIEKMIAIRDLFADPLWKKILDDMVDQKEDGKTPSVLVAVARNVPMEDLQDLADNENYEDIQGAVNQRLEADKMAQESEDQKYASFDESQKAGDAYCQEMGYDDAEKQDLFSFTMQWFKVLGDGKITKEEWAKIDKMRNYDNDVSMLREQMPKEPVKEILPDKSSFQQTAPTQQGNMSKAPKITNSLEAMSAAIPGQPSFIRPRGQQRV